ncbi:hypothetical protein WJX84_006890 [Apatococcus fuscideae]|uniref:Nucleotide-diphospho-sugar transferase domain-containing protein n=1 Tax=Apatococcus fuscideae TaxID=2026836 RepID=A0AAW1T2M9_9CHLO
MPEEHVYLTAFTQQRVNPSKDLLTILMPILPSTAELGYVLNQMRTFSRFADMGSIREYLIITPQKHLLGMETFFHEQLPQLVPDIAATTFRIVTDGDCIPEANPEFQYYRDPAEYWWNGWLTQQLVKLACAPLVQTPFYMVMDADIFAARNFSAQDLFEVSECTEDSAICDTSGQHQLRAKNDCHKVYGDERDQNLEWWNNTALNLQLDVRMDWGCTPGVTPQIMATHISLQLGHWLNSRFQTCCWHGLLLDIGDRHNWRRGDTGLLWSAPWTEYAVYFLFAHHSNLHAAFHVDVRDRAEQLLQDTAVWTHNDYYMWEPCRETFALPRGYMSLVQSRLDMDPAEIWERMHSCLQLLDAAAAEADPAKIQEGLDKLEAAEAEAAEQRYLDHLGSASDDLSDSSGTAAAADQSHWDDERFGPWIRPNSSAAAEQRKPAEYQPGSLPVPDGLHAATERSVNVQRVEPGELTLQGRDSDEEASDASAADQQPHLLVGPDTVEKQQNVDKEEAPPLLMRSKPHRHALDNGSQAL